MCIWRSKRCGVLSGRYVEMIDAFSFPQLIGYGGFILASTASLWRTPTQILWASLVGIGLFVIHYLLLGAYAGAVIDGIAALRCIAALFIPAWYVQVIFYMLPAINLIFGVIGTETVAVGLASILNTRASFSTDAQMMRLFNLLSCPLWLYYNYSNGSVPGMMGDCIGAACNIISIIAYSQFVQRCRAGETV